MAALRYHGAAVFLTKNLNPLRPFGFFRLDWISVTAVFSREAR